MRGSQLCWQEAAGGAAPVQRGHGGRAPRALPAAAGKFHKRVEQNYAPLTVSGRARVRRTNVVGLRFKLRFLLSIEGNLLWHQSSLGGA